VINSAAQHVVSAAEGRGREADSAVVLVLVAAALVAERDI